MLLHRRPKLIPLTRRGEWFLADPWRWREFTIPQGYSTDLDSIPHIPGIHAIFKGRTRVAALLHDYLYSTGKVSRKRADELFLELMKEERVHRVYRELIYSTIRAFGWYRWNQLRKRDKK